MSSCSRPEMTEGSRGIAKQVRPTFRLAFRLCKYFIYQDRFLRSVWIGGSVRGSC